MPELIPESLRMFIEEKGGAESEARIWMTVRQLESEGRNLKNIIMALYRVAFDRALEDSIGEYSRLLEYAQADAEALLPKLEEIVNRHWEKDH